MTIKELLHYCGVPGPCGNETACEGKEIHVKGYIDWENVFDKTDYPNLPYEKFKLTDNNGNSVEIWLASSNSRQIFETLKEFRSTRRQILIKGIATGFDMPIGGSCRKMIKIRLRNAEDITYE